LAALFGFLEEEEMSKKYRKFIGLLNRVLYIGSAAMLIAGAFLTMAPTAASAAPGGPPGGAGAIWTTKGDCGNESQDVNHYKVGEAIYINYKNFTPGLETDWQINATGAGHPVLVGSDLENGIYGGNPITVEPDGNGCFLAFVFTNSEVNQTYQAKFGGVTKNDNFSVDCATGYEWDNSSKTCVLKCPVNSHWDEAAGRHGACVCDTGYEDPDHDGNCTLIPVDLCTNIAGTQTTMPAGYEDPDHDGVCTVIPTDLCTNLEGTQTTMPQGYEDPDHDGVCTVIPTDLCTNLEGTQTTMPQGYEDPDHDGVCTVIPTDLCTNLEGTQSTMPQGYEDPDHDGVCTVIPTDVCNNIEGVQTEIPEGMVSDGEGGCVKPPEDVCNNIEGTQTEIPEGMVSDGEGGCVKPSEPSGGCTDPTALNYDPAATEDDGSCTYKKANPKKPLKVEIDPFCNAEGLMQWTVINPNDVNITMTHFTVDGVNHAGKSVSPGEHNLVATPLGTHTVVIYFNETDTASLTYTINVCPLPIPVTGGEEGAIIPVTGADETANLGMGISFAGMSMIGLALLLSALRKMYHI